MLGAKNAEKTVTLPILMYHCIKDKSSGAYILSHKELENDLKFISENNYTAITVKDLIDNNLPEKPIMLTFDDGCKTIFTTVFPLIQKYNVKIVVAVVGSFLDINYNADGTINPDYQSTLNYEELKTMHNSGLVEIINHSYNMHSYKNTRKGLKNKTGENLETYKKLVAEDLSKLENRLNEKLGITTNAVAYPFGYHTKTSNQIIKELGYKAVLTCTEGVNYIDSDSEFFVLKRFNRTNKKPLSKILTTVLVNK